MHQKLAEVEHRAKLRYPDRNVSVSFLEDCDPLFAEYLHTDTRVKVTNLDFPAMTRTGRVGVTGGWNPVFILLPRRDSVGSSDTLGPRDKVVGVRVDGSYTYRAVTA